LALSAESTFNSNRARFDACQDRGFYSLVALSRALSGGARSVPCQISVVADQLLDPHLSRSIWPEKAPLVGLGPVIAQEYPQLGFQAIDREAPSRSEVAEAVRSVLAEVLHEPPAPRVVLRHGDRFLPAVEPIRLGRAVRRSARVGPARASHRGSARSVARGRS
jgi:hypothetical protein